MFYFACLQKDEESNSFLVTFPDVPNAITEGNTLEEALSFASEVLTGVLELDIKEGFEIPFSKSYTGDNYHPITVSPAISLAYKTQVARKEK